MRHCFHPSQGKKTKKKDLFFFFSAEKQQLKRIPFAKKKLGLVLQFFSLVNRNFSNCSFGQIWTTFLCALGVAFPIEHVDGMEWYKEKKWKRSRKIEKKQIELKKLPENKTPSKISLDIEKLFQFPYCFSIKNSFFRGSCTECFSKIGKGSPDYTRTGLCPVQKGNFAKICRVCQFGHFLWIYRTCQLNVTLLEFICRLYGRVSFLSFLPSYDDQYS